MAVLAPRELAGYLPRRLLLAQRWLGVVAVAVALAVVSLDVEPPAASGTGETPRALVVVLACVAALFAVVLERLERWLLQRPQPFTTADLVAADDAVRSQSVHSLAGSGLAVELVCLGGILAALANSQVQVLRSTMWIPALACVVGAVWVCLYYGHRAWRVRRAVPAAA